MADKFKTILAFLLFLGSLVLPLFGFLVGWQRWDATTGLILMFVIFLIMIILGSLVLLRMKDLSWLSVYMPYIFGTVYSFLPDTIPFSVDDAAATTAGAFFSYLLVQKKQAGTSKWVFIPLLAAGLYALLGGFLPGPIDEFIVDSIALILAWVGTRRKSKATNQ
jgi:hypothetical protein